MLRYAFISKIGDGREFRFICDPESVCTKASEISVQFKRPPEILFGLDERFSLSPNLLVIRIQPNEGITLYLNSKKLPA